MPDKPLAILCNPPYRSDDDQAASSISYAIHPSILELIGLDASSERYCCFLAQMKLLCAAAKSTGLPGESLLLLFTKSAWLTKRPTFGRIRKGMLGEFEDVAGLLINGSEFFGVTGSWPVAFTIWRHKGAGADLDSNRPIRLIDMTWLKHDHLARICWDDLDAVDESCRDLVKDERSTAVILGEDRVSIRAWSGLAMTDFKRDRDEAKQQRRSSGAFPQAIIAA